MSEFIADRTARGLSPATLEFYDKYLTPFVSRSDSLLEVVPANIGAYLQSLTCGPGGRHASYRAIRALYRWMEEQGHIASDPTRRMKAPKVPKPVRYAVPVRALGTLLEACDSVRDQLIVSLLADTGLRRSELSSVSIPDVNLSAQTIRVWGKGAKQRIVRYGPATGLLLAKYLESTLPTGSLLGLTADGIRQMLDRLHRATGIQCNAHAFRRTFATESVRNGLNLFYVQSLLGHATLTMTRIYAEQVNSEDAIKAYKPIVT